MGNDEAFAKIVNRLDRLPTLPGIAIRLLEAVQKEEPDLEEIGYIISTDPPLSAEVLKIINSPFYGLVVKVTSVFQAITLLGINAIKNLVLSFSLVNHFRADFAAGFDYTLFWKDSLIGAVATKLLAEKILPLFAEDAFFLGLLHNIGILTLLQCMPKQYSLVLKEMQHTNHAYEEAEDQILGFNHMAVGECLVKSWGLPETFYAPIGCHHHPDELITNNKDLERLAKILHMSTLYIDFFNLPNSSLNLGLLGAWIDEYGFSDIIGVDEIGCKIHEHTQNIFPLFEIKLKEDIDYTRILEAARIELVNLSNDLISDILEQKREIQKLKKEVTVDGMTQLDNYQHFYKMLHQEMYRSARYKSPLSLILGDLDHFKAINDRYGHLAGDQTLREIATCLKRSLRASDHLARYGGEEFAVILPETTLESALSVAERLRKEIQSLEVVHEDKKFSLTISCGIAFLAAGEHLSEEEFVRRADKALYHAKAKGKNQSCAYHPKPDSADRRMDTKTQIPPRESAFSN